MDWRTYHFTLYGPNLIFLIVSLSLSVLILRLSLLLIITQPDASKIAAYECGFDPFDDARNPFDIQFYLIAILFLLFDIEAIFIYPWATTLRTMGRLNFWTIIDFILELVAGYIYSWRVGAFDF